MRTSLRITRELNTCHAQSKCQTCRRRRAGHRCFPSRRPRRIGRINFLAIPCACCSDQCRFAVRPQMVFFLLRITQARPCDGSQCAIRLFRTRANFLHNEKPPGESSDRKDNKKSKEKFCRFARLQWSRCHICIPSTRKRFLCRAGSASGTADKSACVYGCFGA